MSEFNEILVYRILFSEIAGEQVQHYTDQALDAGGMEISRLQGIVKKRRKAIFQCDQAPAPGNWPTPLSRAMELFLNEPVEYHFRQVHRAIDCFEVLVKYLAVISLSDLLRQSEFSDDLKQMLAASLETPSLGHWVGYLRTGVSEMKRLGLSPFMPELPKYQAQKINRYADPILSIRNYYAHGSTPDDTVCRKHLVSLLENLMRLLHGALFLCRYPLICRFDGQTNQAMGSRPVPYDTAFEFAQSAIALENSEQNGWLPFSPLIIERTENPDESDRFYIYNKMERRKESVHLLNYASGDQTRSKSVYQQVIDSFPITDWKARKQVPEQEAGMAFSQQAIIKDLTRSFSGRLKELDILKDWIGSRVSGILLVTGAPGIGKSAIMAMLSEKKMIRELLDNMPEELAGLDLQTGEEKNGAREWYDDWKQSMAAFLESIEVLPFFITRNSVSSNPKFFLEHLIRGLNRLAGLKEMAQGSPEDLAGDILPGQMETAGRQMAEKGKKLVILIDGLDEALPEKEQASFEKSVLAYLPRTIASHVHFVMAGRPVRQVIDIYKTYDPGKRRHLEVRGLSQENVRSLFYQATDRYQLFSNDGEKYIDEVVRLSNGLPLYVTLLVDQIAEGRTKMLDLAGLPASISEIYSDMVEKFRRRDSSNVLFLMLLSIAKEVFTAGQVAGINGVDVTDAASRIEDCREVLNKGTSPDTRSATYRIFHDSFSEFMKQHQDYQAVIPKIEHNLLAFVCTTAGMTLDDSVNKIIRAMVEQSSLPADETDSLGRVLENAASLLTTRALVLRSMTGRPIHLMEKVYETLSAGAGPAASNIIASCLTAAGAAIWNAKNPDPEKAALFSGLLLRMINRTAQDSPANTASIRIALKVVADLSNNHGSDGWGSSVEDQTDDDGHPLGGVQKRQAFDDLAHQVILAACHSNDENIQMMGIVSAYRLIRAGLRQGNHSTDLLEKMAQGVLVWKFPRPSRVVPFAGTVLCLLFEMPDNKALTSALKPLCAGIVNRIPGLGLAKWFLPPVVSALFSKVPDDYNPMNLLEISTLKNSVIKDAPEFFPALEALIEYIDPGYGDEKTLHSLLAQVDPKDMEPGQTFLVSYILQAVFISRSLSGDESMLETAYQYWEAAKDTDHIMCQDVMFEIRIIQMGLVHKREAPLADKWTERMEKMVDHFFYRKNAVFHVNQPYLGGAIIAALPFLARQTGTAELPIVRQMVDHVFEQDFNPHDEEKEKEKRLDGILLRILEVDAVEYGTYDAPARSMALFGLNCFLDHAEGFEAFHWQRVAMILARVNVYYPEEIEQFISGLSQGLRENITSWMNRVFPEENVGALISMRSELLYAAMFSESPGNNTGLRSKWQQMLRLLIAKKSLNHTLREMIGMIFSILR